MRNTSLSVPGTAPSAPVTSPNTMATGKAVEANTDRTAAIKVVTRYRVMTVLKRPPTPALALETEAMTRIPTNIGAILLSTPTNNSPSILIADIPGHIIANREPMTTPARMRSIRLVLTHFSISFIASRQVYRYIVKFKEKIYTGYYLIEI